MAQTEKELIDLSKELEAAQAKLNAKKQEKEKLLGNVDLARKRERAADARGRPREAADRAERRSLRWPAEHWYSQPMAFLRSLPGIDLAPPTKIQQISLPELLINYNFKEVPRYDRCQTCHQGIDRIGYEKDAEGKDMPTVFKSHPLLQQRCDDRRSPRQVGEGRPLPGRQRPAPDQQLRLHDLPRRPGLGDRFHVRLAYARFARASRGMEEGARLGGFPLLGFPDASRPLHRVAAA